MSGIGNVNGSYLPEELEEKLKKAQQVIAELVDVKEKAESDAESAKIALASVNEQLTTAEKRLADITSLCDVTEAEMADRKSKLDQRESALEVYANALAEKEKKIDKYLKVFENMKDVIS